MLQGLILEGTFDHPGKKGRYKDNRPPEPHVLNTGRLPSATLDEVWEEISELFHDKLGFSVSSPRQSYQRSYNASMGRSSIPSRD
jgi:hypothetical protein